MCVLLLPQNLSVTLPSFKVDRIGLFNPFLDLTRLIQSTFKEGSVLLGQPFPCSGVVRISLVCSQ